MMRAILELGRISNLPTVWTNVIAAWVLTCGGVSWETLVFAVGASLLYLGGTTLNDAFDVDFDSKFRRERPIPSGRLSRRAVWILGFGWLAAGTATLLVFTRSPWLFVLLLVGAIVLYDVVHKRSPVGVLIMGACRFLLYVTAGSAVLEGILNVRVIWLGAATGLYVVGLSIAARGEATGRGRPWWPLPFLAAPLALAAVWTVLRQSLAGGVFMTLAAFWLGIALAQLHGQEDDRIGKAVSKMLAGLVLIDAFAVSIYDWKLALGMIGVFLVTLALQRQVPAT